jgi:hypothetical protein
LSPDYPLTLVEIGLDIVGLLVLLVNNGVLGSRGTSAQLGIVILGDVLVGLLGGLSTGALDGLGDVVCGVLLEVLIIAEVVIDHDHEP